MAKQRRKKRSRWISLRGVLLTLVMAGLGALGYMGWEWISLLRVERIELTGLHHTDSTAVMELARVDTGLVLIDVDPALVADRVRRHPWVQTAEATRYPTGTLRIAVQERRPVMLVVDRRGQPSHYLDRAGFAMPREAETRYNLPVLRGLRERYHPVRRVQSETVRELLGALGALDAETDALLSELEVQSSGAVRLHTTPIGERGALEVWLGRDGFAEKLARLRAFWHQAVLPQPNKIFQVIDLRFDGQIVTREATAEEARSSGSSAAR